MTYPTKKMAALAAAIQAYIQEEEAMLAAAAPALAPVVEVPSTVHNLWGLAGRQLGMQMRFLLQRRSLR